MADTREAILESAWNLFAEKGFEDVSVRDVTNRADVNLASVSYHFGGKDGLMQEIVKRCLNPVYEYRMKLLDEAVQEFGNVESIPLRHLLVCWLRPLLLSEECGVRFDLILRLIARYLIEIDYSIPALTQQLLSKSYNEYIHAFECHFSKLKTEGVLKYMIFLEGAGIYTSGIGKGLIQILNGEEVDRTGVDREKVLEEVICCAMDGVTGKCMN